MDEETVTALMLQRTFSSEWTCAARSRGQNRIDHDQAMLQAEQSLAGSIGCGDAMDEKAPTAVEKTRHPLSEWTGVAQFGGEERIK